MTPGRHWHPIWIRRIRGRRFLGHTAAQFRIRRTNSNSLPEPIAWHRRAWCRGLRASRSRQLRGRRLHGESTTTRSLPANHNWPGFGRHSARSPVRLSSHSRGAGTGLSGGATPIHGGLVIATSRMHRIREIDAENMRAIVEPGLVNVDLTRAAEPFGLYFAPDPLARPRRPSAVMLPRTLVAPIASRMASLPTMSSAWKQSSSTAPSCLAGPWQVPRTHPDTTFQGS